MTARPDGPGRAHDDPAAVTGAERALLEGAYAAYNRQDADGLLAFVGDEVDWPDGAGRLRGKAAVRAYWAQQWTRTRTHDQPLVVARRADGGLAVRISQVVRSLDGSVVSAGFFVHVHRIMDGRIVGMDIENA